MQYMKYALTVIHEQEKYVQNIKSILGKYQLVHKSPNKEEPEYYRPANNE